MSTVTLTGDDYRYRFTLEAKKQFIELLKELFIDVPRERFNTGVTFNGRLLKWDTVIEHKTIELARFLTRKSSTFDIGEPPPKLERQDAHALRTKILELNSSDARVLGIGKSTLHYLRREARQQNPFRVYSKTLERFQ